MTVRNEQSTYRRPRRLRRLAIGFVATAVFAAWGVGCFYYYNTFVAMTSKLASDMSDCDVAMQERHHITVSLANVVVAYYTYVQDLLGHITDLRGGRLLPQLGTAAPAVAVPPGSPPNPTALATAIERLGPKELKTLFSRMRLVAEQHPQLRLTENFQQLADAVVEAEHRVAQLLIVYNKDVKSYMTVRNQWPARHFAMVLSFKPVPFMAIDAETLKFKPVAY